VRASFLFSALRRAFGAAVCALAAGAVLAMAGAVEVRRSDVLVRGGKPATSPPLGKICVGDTIARLSIERLGVETPIREGVDEVTLAQGPGHVPGTALPGEAGRRHAVIATARDSADPFVGKIVIGDRVEVTTPFGPRVYRVVQRHTIPAGELDIEPTHEPTLTLVAPYPADAVGPAPLRLVVRARLVDDALRRADSGSLARPSGQTTILADLAASWAFAEGR
jgi:sortase A